jgi:RNA polymerase primary sigma factor
MTTGRPSHEMARFANLDCSENEVLTPRLERGLLLELAECKSKLAKALASIEGIDVRPATNDPQTLAQYIANVYSGDGPEQASLGAVYHRYSELRCKLALANLKLVAHVAKRFRDRGIPYYDLMQEGFCGMLEAIDRFNMTHETKLATYATWWIRQSITRAIADQGRTIRTPVHMVETGNRLASARNRLVQICGREPTVDELAQEVGLAPAKANMALLARREPVSLETPAGEDGSARLVDFVADGDSDDALDALLRKRFVEGTRDLLATLTAREAQVLKMRFGLDGGNERTLAEIGESFDLTRERIRQIETQALRKLRLPTRAKRLRAIFDG